MRGRILTCVNAVDKFTEPRPDAREKLVGCSTTVTDEPLPAGSLFNSSFPDSLLNIVLTGESEGGDSFGVVD